MAASPVRAAYLVGLDTVRELLDTEAVRDGWDGPSVLADMKLSSLIGHVSLSATQVERFLDTIHPETHRVDASNYYARLTDTHEPDSSFNRQILARADAAADGGYDAVTTRFAEATDRLAFRLERETPERTVAIAHRPGEVMLMDEYLRTRCVEIAVHVDDIASTLGIDVQVPEPTSIAAIDVLFEAASLRHGSRAVLRALARRERDLLAALRVL